MGRALQKGKHHEDQSQYFLKTTNLSEEVVPLR